MVSPEEEEEEEEGSTPIGCDGMNVNTKWRIDTGTKLSETKPMKELMCTGKAAIIRLSHYPNHTDGNRRDSRRAYQQTSNPKLLSRTQPQSLNPRGCALAQVAPASWLPRACRLRTFGLKGLG